MEKKNPRIPPWKVWILIIITIQAISAIQNFWSHRLLWDGLFHQSEIVKSHIEDTNQYQVELNQILVEQKRALEYQKQALEHQNQILKEYCK